MIVRRYRRLYRPAGKMSWIGRSIYWQTSMDKWTYIEAWGLQRDVVCLCWPMSPSYTSPNAGDSGGCSRVSANEYSCAQHVTWSPNKLWRSTSILNLWLRRDLGPQPKRRFYYRRVRDLRQTNEQQQHQIELFFHDTVSGLYIFLFHLLPLTVWFLKGMYP
jgi:hypothetical protein